MARKRKKLRRVSTRGGGSMGALLDFAFRRTGGKKAKPFKKK